MKRHLLFLLLAVLLVTGPFLGQAQTAPATQTKQAQQPQTPELRAEAMTAGMAKNLRLNPAQTEKVREINLSSIERVEMLRAQFKTEPSRLDREVKSVSSARLSQLKEVLSPAQFSAYQQRRETKMGIPQQANAQP